MGQDVWQEPVSIALWLLLFGNVIAVLVGVLMIIAPQRLARWMHLPNRWISTQAFTERLEQMRDVDSYAFRHARIVGLALLTGALFILVQGGQFVSHLGVADGARLLADLFDGRNLPPALWETLWLSLVALLVLGALLALVVGLLGLFGQSWLQGFSRVVNRWVSTRRGTEALDVPHYPLDTIIRDRPRLWGAVIVLLGTYTAAALFWVWRM